MALDATAQQIVDLLTEFFPDFGGEITDAAAGRAVLAQAPLLPVTEECASVVERTVPGPAGAPEVPVRIYRPIADQSTVTPVLLWFHGGGFTIGNLDGYEDYCRAMAREAGVTVVSVEYRLAPETRFPGGLEDAYAVTSWVSEHAAELLVDPARLAVAGDSSGGNFAAVLSQMARDRRRAGEQSPDIAFQLLVYPTTDLYGETQSRIENGEGYFLTTQHMRWFGQQYLADEAAERSNPRVSPLLAADLADLPPAFVLTAEHDPLCDEGEAYAARLAESGVPTELVRFDGMFHGFLTLWHPASAKARAATYQAVAAALGGS
jgi:acetyl esterase